VLQAFVRASFDTTLFELLLIYLYLYAALQLLLIFVLYVLFLTSAHTVVVFLVLYIILHMRSSPLNFSACNCFGP